MPLLCTLIQSVLLNDHIYVVKTHLLYQNSLKKTCYVATAFWKPKGVAEKFKKHRGPFQRCNVGFFSAEENVILIREILHRYELKVW